MSDALERVKNYLQLRAVRVSYGQMHPEIIHSFGTGDVHSVDLLATDLAVLVDEAERAGGHLDAVGCDEMPPAQMGGTT